MRLATMAALTALACFGLALLAGCPTVDLGDQPPEPRQCLPDMQYYHDHIWPEYLAPTDASKSCVANSGCHQAANGRSALRLETDPVDDVRNYQEVTRFLNCGMPDVSQLLSKPLKGGDLHGGGDVFASTSDPQVQVFLKWFAP
jgi:hypothetical protein